MPTSDGATKLLEDSKVSVKLKLSALWAALMFLYTYGDILGFYTPGTIEDLISGKAGAIQITDAFLIVMAAWMAIPSVMVFLSLSLKVKANRWSNIVLATVSMLMLAATFFAGEFSVRYAFHALVEGVLIMLIFWHAWNWPAVNPRTAIGA
jgi:hypothetical protein